MNITASAKYDFMYEVLIDDLASLSYTHICSTEHAVQSLRVYLYVCTCVQSVWYHHKLAVSAHHYVEASSTCSDGFWVKPVCLIDETFPELEIL